MVDPDLADEERVLARLEWDVVKFHCAGLKKAEDYSPVRFYVEDYPFGDQFWAIGRGQESRDGGASATRP